MILLLLLLLLLYTSCIMCARKNFYSCITCICGFLRPVNWKYLYIPPEKSRGSHDTIIVYIPTDVIYTRRYACAWIRRISNLLVATGRWPGPASFFRDIMLLVIIIYMVRYSLFPLRRDDKCPGHFPFHCSNVFMPSRFNAGCLFPKLFSFQNAHHTWFHTSYNDDIITIYNVRFFVWNDLSTAYSIWNYQSINYW
jgi:hypothetical protein